jgi:uncharacterized protein with NRDE domain
MCIAAFAWNPDSNTPLLLASNRDEFFARPTEAMHWWHGTDLLAGRDLKADGAWLGITRSGRFAMLTNIRNPALRFEGAPSRGALPRRFLESDVTPPAYLHDLARGNVRYEGFNLLCGTFGTKVHEMWFLNSMEYEPKALKAGLYGLSNASLDTAWPKVQRIKQGLLHALAERDLDAQRERLLRLLQNATPTPDHQLPNTGVPFEWERALGSIFINRDGYGTRASTVMRAERHQVNVSEVNYAPDASISARNDFSFELPSTSG